MKSSLCRANRRGIFTCLDVFVRPQEGTLLVKTCYCKGTISPAPPSYLLFYLFPLLALSSFPFPICANEICFHPLLARLDKERLEDNPANLTFFRSILVEHCPAPWLRHLDQLFTESKLLNRTTVMICNPIISSMLIKQMIVIMIKLIIGIQPIAKAQMLEAAMPKKQTGLLFDIHKKHMQVTRNVC